LTYLSMTTASVFEAGTIAGLGLVWSMRRMQKKWERAREFWESEITEEGRRALKQAEDDVKQVLDEGVEIDDELNQENIKARRAARMASARVRTALAEINKTA
jgi:hypothetical protein